MLADASTAAAAGHARRLLNFVVLDATETSIESETLRGIANVTCLCSTQRDGSDITAEQLSAADVIGVWHTVFIDEKFIREKINPHVTKLICRFGAGHDNCDKPTLAKLNIVVCNAPCYGTEEVADSTMSHVLNMYRQTAHLSHAICNERRVIKGPDAIAAAAAEAGGTGADPSVTCCRRIRGEVLGIIGLGRIGSAVVMRAKAFGFSVCAYDPFVAPGWEKSLGITRCATLHELLKTADCVTLHACCTPENKKMLSFAQFAIMKPTSLLVNTARGELIDEAALKDALETGKICAAALDVHNEEPFSEHHGLFGLRNLTCTPHCAWYSRESRIEMRTTCASYVASLAEQLERGVKREDLVFPARVN